MINTVYIVVGIFAFAILFWWLSRVRTVAHKKKGGEKEDLK